MPKQANTSIPLLCDLCPKKPRFSDVSHLLTHISSKSHLSNRFKLQIRSQGEPEARRLLADFDSWYADNGLEDLLSERMAAKEHKTTKRTRLPSATTKAHMKAEPNTETKAKMKAENPQEPPLAATPAYRPPIPPLNSWSTDPYVTGFAEPPMSSRWAGNAIYETPTMKRSIPNFTRNPSPIPPSAIPINPTPLKADISEDEVEKEGSKLKGVYWPGMNLFDSATAEMKRMRNQKKDGTALQQMKRSSAEIEPTEWIFNADGEFCRARDIFDESAESSPVRSVVAPSPKKRRTRKGALTEMSSNAPRLKGTAAKQPTKRAATKRKLITSDPAETAPKRGTYSSHLSMLTNIQFSPSSEDQEEFRLTMGNLGKGRQFGIFCDAEEHSPSRTESPLEDHRFDFSIGRSAIPSKPANITPNSPTPMFKTVPMRFGGKENSDPVHINRLLSTAASGFHPDIFHSDSLNPLFSHSHAHTYNYGDREGFQADIKSGFSGLGSDFKPLMTTDPFRGMIGPHGLHNIAGPGIADNIRYGM